MNVSAPPRLLLLPLLLLALAAGCDADRRSPAADRPAASAAAAAAPAAPDLRSAGYERGLPYAPVTVVELSDFGCPYCARFALETYPELHRRYVAAGQVRWRYVPMVLGIFPNGDLAALAAECAAEQQRFWPMHDLLYERQREWKETGEPEALFQGYARGLGLSERRFGECYRGEAARERVRRNTELAASLGVRATPSFLVNGRPVQGALPAEQFGTLIDQALAGK